MPGVKMRRSAGRWTIFPCCQAWYELWLILQGEKEEPLEEILGFCRKPGTGAESCDVAYGQARQQLLMDNRLMEQRMAAGEQIRQTAGAA